MRFKFLCLLTVLLAGEFVYAGSNDIRLHVRTDNTKVNGSAWDGFGGEGGMKGILFTLPTKGPPDIDVCLVEPDKHPVCFAKTLTRRNGKTELASLCHNSYECDMFDFRTLPDLFGVLIIDLDKFGKHDLIDGVIVSKTRRKRSDPGVLSLDNRLRKLAKEKAPYISKGEEMRRARPAPVVLLEDCLENSPCRLRQSKITFIKF